ncbi:MAG: hypothetical protein KA735_11315 [Burkholderiaceae bacterium]|nr:hypothetical protein [Burkholderiaceae bacterium]
MSYVTFVSELNKGIEGAIIAYDNRKEHGGCVLHLSPRPYTIFVPAEIIDHRRKEAISALRVKIRSRNWEDHHLAIVRADDGLKFEAEGEHMPEGVSLEATII